MNQIQFGLGEEWFLVGNGGYVGLYAPVRVIAKTTIHDARKLVPGLVELQFCHGGEEILEMMNANPLLYIGEYTRSEPSGEYEKGELLLFGEYCLDLNRTHRL